MRQFCLPYKWMKTLFIYRRQGKKQSQLHLVSRNISNWLNMKESGDTNKSFDVDVVTWHVFMCFDNSLSLWLWPLASWALYFLLTYPNLIILYIWNFIFLLSLLRSILSPLSNTVHSHSFEVSPHVPCVHPSLPPFVKNLNETASFNLV